MALMTGAEMEVATLTYRGFTANEIASMTNRSRSTVKELRRRGRRRLQSKGLEMPELPRLHKPGARTRASYGQKVLDAN